MGWGSEPHEGYPDDRRVDGTWTQGTWRGAIDDPDAVAAACSCGWRSERAHEIGAPPERDTPAREAWSQRREQAEDACFSDWQGEHLQPLLGYEPHTLLILGRSEGGPRHFLNGQAVHAGATLELLLARDVWVRIRYEWTWRIDEPPTAHLELGAPDGAQRLGYSPLVSFPLPSQAVLRWPAEKAER